MPDNLDVSLDEAIPLAQRLLDQRLPFHAHDVLEGAWKQAPAAERDLWHGLAQLAVGLTHAYRGNTTGARTLFARSRRRLALFADHSPRDVDIAGLIAWSDDTTACLAPRDAPTATLEGLIDELPIPRLRRETMAREVGTTVCWLDQVCTVCGRLDEPPSPICSRCSTPRG